MAYVALYDSHGEIIGLGRSDSDAEFSLPEALSMAIDSETFAAIKKARGGYVQNGRVVCRPHRPGPYYSWRAIDKAWVHDVVVERDAMASDVRSARNRLLLESDWTDTLSAKQRLGDQLYGAWQTYRQALRDISEQVGFPLNIDWPQPPV